MSILNTHLKISIVRTVSAKPNIEIDTPMIVMKERTLSNVSFTSQPSVLEQRSYIEKYIIELLNDFC